MTRTQPRSESWSQPPYQPPSPPRRRRRGLGWLIALVILAIILVVADRVGASLAGSAAERYLAKQALFESPPKVAVNGVPFLTQAIAGRYDDIEVRSSAVTLAGVEATDLDARLHGVHLPLSAAFGQSISSLPVDRVEGTLQITYAQIVKLSQIRDLTIANPDGQLQISATLKIPQTNTTTTVSGVGDARVVGGSLRLVVSHLTVAGLSVNDAVLSQLTATLATPIPIPTLPYGLRLDSVTPGPDGLLVGGSGDHVVITRTGA